MLEGSDDIISGVKMYHDLYKEFTPHTLMSRVNHDQFMLATGTMDGKIDYRAAPARFVAQIREGTRKYKAMYKEECVPESRICGIMLTRLPKMYDSAVKRLGTKPPGTQAHTADGSRGIDHCLRTSAGNSAGCEAPRDGSYGV